MAEPEQSQKREEPRYDAGYLVEHAPAVFGVSANPHLVAGALAGESRQTHTAAQAKEVYRKFLKREVPAYDGVPEHEVPEEFQEDEDE